MAVLVSWALNPAFVRPGPYTFKLQRGRAANDDNFVDIAETVDQAWLFDNNPIFDQIDRSTFYRVILTDGTGTVHISQSVSADMTWSRVDWRLMRDIIRKETLVQRMPGGGGTKGYLLKRRTWGDPCADCVDPSTGSILDSHCLICFGTGVVGGYYPPVEFWVILDPTVRLKKIAGDEGLVTATMETARTLAWPAPDADDVWVMAHRNRRFRIDGDIQAIARHRGVDVLLSLHLNELPLENMAFEVPTP